MGGGQWWWWWVERQGLGNKKTEEIKSKLWHTLAEHAFCQHGRSWANHTRIRRDKRMHRHICPDVVMWLAGTLSQAGCIYETFEQGWALGSCARSPHTTPHPTIIERLGLSGPWASVVVSLLLPSFFFMSRLTLSLSLLSVHLSVPLSSASPSALSLCFLLSTYPTIVLSQNEYMSMHNICSDLMASCIAWNPEVK